MNLRKIIFTGLFLLIMLFPINAFAETDSKPIDLSTWYEVVPPYLYAVDTNWRLNSTKTAVTETINGRPTILLSDIQCINNSVNGTFCVNSTDGDDDFIGFVFGYQDTGHFYLFDWKQRSQGDAYQGMTVKVVSSDSIFENNELWPTMGNNKVKTLYHNNIGYNLHTNYRFTLSFSDKGIFNIIVKDGDTVLDNITINDSTYTSGKFGLYNYSQSMVLYENITISKVPFILKANSGYSKVTLNWNDINNTKNYVIKRSQKAGGPYTTIATPSAISISDTTTTTSSALSFTDTTVVNDTTYYYVVSAVNDNGEESNSNEVMVTPKKPDISLEVTSVDKAKAGDIITANVVIHKAINICAEDIKIAFDTTKLQFINAEGADGIKIYKEDGSTNGLRRYITASLGKTNAANGDKVLLKLKFKAIGKGNALIDITKGRIADNSTLEMDVDDVKCGQKTIVIEGPNDVNRSGKYTLLDLGIDAWYYGDLVSNTDTSKYETDQVINGKIDDDDLAYIVAQMLNNVDYTGGSIK